MSFIHLILFGYEYRIQIWTLLDSEPDKIRLGELSIFLRFCLYYLNYLVSAWCPDVIPQVSNVVFKLFNRIETVSLLSVCSWHAKKDITYACIDGSCIVKKDNPF